MIGPPHFFLAYLGKRRTGFHPALASKCNAIQDNNASDDSIYIHYLCFVTHQKQKGWLFKAGQGKALT